MRTCRVLGIGARLMRLPLIPVLLAVAGCAADGPPDAPVALLQAHFAAHAPTVLGARAAEAITAAPTGAGFIVARAAGAPDAIAAAEAALAHRRGLQAVFPAAGDAPVRLSLPDGFAVEVHELGPRGAGRVHGRALVYDHGDGAGASFWSAAGGGVEEWLLTRPASDGAVAAWEVRGGALRQRGAAVEVVDGAGRVRALVTAPRAHAAGGGEVALALTAGDGRLVLRVADPGALPAHAFVLADPVWTAAGALATARFWHTATLLPSGKVLVAGGVTDSKVPVSSAEIYDPASNSWSAAGAMATARHLHTATLLPSGRVLVAGGDPGNGVPDVQLASAELYDPASGTWSAAGALAQGRWYHTATLLSSGKVLVAGGHGWIDSAELYDPTANTWSATGGLARGRTQHTATLLPSGKVLVFGGDCDAKSLADPASAELYDPDAGTWGSAAPLTMVWSNHSATLLPSGEVLVAGGGWGTGAALYDPGRNTWRETADLRPPNSGHSATLLASGQVLIVGGNNSAGLCTRSAQLYDPAAGAWTATCDLATSRLEHTATLLPSGRVLLVGGECADILPRANAELYDPASDADCTPEVRPDAGTGRDAGSDAADGGRRDAAGPDAALPDGSVSDAPSGLGLDAWAGHSDLIGRGCDCEAGHTGRLDSALGLLLLAGAVVVGRRRRTRPR